MQVYFAIKFYEDMSNRELIEFVTATIERGGHSCIVAVRDFEQWGQKKLAPQELMQKVRQNTRKADLILVELSEKGVGLGLEIGFALALGKSIAVLAHRGTDISETVKGSIERIYYYGNKKELTDIIVNLVKEK